MGLARDEAYVGGRAYRKLRNAAGGAATAERLESVTILETNRGGCRCRLESGKEVMLPWNLLEPDHDYLDERDAKEEAKRERIRREANEPFQLHAVGNPPPSTGLKVSMESMLAAHNQKAPSAPPPPVQASPSAAAPSAGAQPLVKEENDKVAREMVARVQLVTEARGFNAAELAACTYGVASAMAISQWFYKGTCTFRDPPKRVAIAKALGIEEELLFDTTRSLPDDIAPYNTPELFGERVRALARMRGWPRLVDLQRAGGDEFGKGSMHGWYSGAVTPVTASVAKLAKLFGVTVGVLYGTEPMPAEKPKPNGAPVHRPEPAPAPKQQLELEEEPQGETIKQRHARELREEAEWQARQKASVAAAQKVAAQAAAVAKPEPDYDYFSNDVKPEPAKPAQLAPSNMIAAWMDMGRRLREPLEHEMREIRRELSAIKPRVDELRGRYDMLKTQLQMMDQLTGQK